MNPLAQRFEVVREGIALAARRARRDEAGVELVAISKRHPVELIQEAVTETGQDLFGESRVQEAMMKIPVLPSRLHWHFIGHLQSNKVRKALPFFELFHGVDTPEIAREMDRIAGEMGLFPRVLLEVNVSGEGSKHGFSPELLERELDGLLSLPRLEVEGLMTMAPLVAEQEMVRPYFARLRELRDHMALRAGIPFAVLSMGMSGDFEVAVEEGATLVRIGSALFGGR